MSLADELLADLEDGADEAQGEGEEDDIDHVDDVAEASMETDQDQNSVHSIAKLRDSEEVSSSSILFMILLNSFSS